MLFCVACKGFMLQCICSMFVVYARVALVNTSSIRIRARVIICKVLEFKTHQYCTDTTYHMHVHLRVITCSVFNKTHLDLPHVAVTQIHIRPGHLLSRSARRRSSSAGFRSLTVPASLMYQMKCTDRNSRGVSTHSIQSRTGGRVA